MDDPPGTVAFNIVSYTGGLAMGSGNREKDIAYIAREVGRLETRLESMALREDADEIADIPEPQFSFGYNSTCRLLLVEYWVLCNQLNRLI
jgi:hypothetical protein